MKFIEKREKILNGNLLKIIITLSWPLMINNFIQTIYNLTDTYFVGKLPGNKIAAIQFVWPIIFFLMSFGIGISMAGTGLISQYLGANENENAKKISGQVLSFSFIFSSLIGLFGAIFAKDILIIMQATPNIIENATEFLSIIFLGMPTMFMMFAYRAIKQGEGDTFTPMILTGLSVGLNIVLDPLLMFGLDLGIVGAAIATVLARAIFAAYGLYTLFKKNNDLQLHLHHLKIDLQYIKKLLQVGLPSSIGQSTAALGFAVLNSFILSYGEVTLAAFALGNRISSMIMMPAMGVGTAITTIVGQNLGANQIKRARQSVKTSIYLTTIISIIGGAFLLAISSWVVQQFTRSPEIIAQGTYYLRIITLTLPLMAYYQIFNGTFRGSGHTLFSMGIMIGRLWVLRIPMIAFANHFLHSNHEYIWYAMILSNLISVLIGYGIYLSDLWESKVISKKVNQSLEASN